MGDRVIVLTDDVIHNSQSDVYCVFLIDELDIHFIRYYLRHCNCRLIIDVNDEKAKRVVERILSMIEE